MKTLIKNILASVNNARNALLLSKSGTVQIGQQRNPGKMITAHEGLIREQRRTIESRIKRLDGTPQEIERLKELYVSALPNEPSHNPARAEKKTRNRQRKILKAANRVLKNYQKAKELVADGTYETGVFSPLQSTLNRWANKSAH